MASRDGQASSRQKPDPLEEDIIGIFVQLAQMLSLPRSLGEIYGLLFVCSEPLTLDDVVLRLGISKGSASQGLRQLKALGAVHPEYRAGDRREHFTPEMELRKIAAGFLKEHVTPHLQSTQQRLQSLDTQLTKKEKRSNQPFLRDRIERLRGWHRNSRDLLPFLSSFLKS